MCNIKVSANMTEVLNWTLTRKAKPVILFCAYSCLVWWCVCNLVGRSFALFEERRVNLRRARLVLGRLNLPFKTLERPAQRTPTPSRDVIVHVWIDVATSSNSTVVTLKLITFDLTMKCRILWYILSLKFNRGYIETHYFWSDGEMYLLISFISQIQ